MVQAAAARRGAFAVRAPMRHNVAVGRALRSLAEALQEHCKSHTLQVAQNLRAQAQPWPPGAAASVALISSRSRQARRLAAGVRSR